MYQRRIGVYLDFVSVAESCVDDRTTLLESAVEQLQLTVLSFQQRLDAIEARGPVGAAAAVLALTEDPSEVEPRRRPARVEARIRTTRSSSFARRPAPPRSCRRLLSACDDRCGACWQPGRHQPAPSPTRRCGSSWRSRRRPRPVTECRLPRAGSRPGRVPADRRGDHPLQGADRLASAVVLSVLERQRSCSSRGAERLRAVAWLTVIGALPASAAILVQTGVVAPFALYLVALGLATLWLGYSIDGGAAAGWPRWRPTSPSPA